jgi:hypothetical protein
MKMKAISRLAVATALTTSCAATLAHSEDKPLAKPATETAKPYSPYAGRNYPTRPYFGDTHVHTGMSLDAGAFGCTLKPRDAYKFAKGEEIVASSNQKTKLSRPLDFLVVSDHSDQMGFITDLFAGEPELLKSPQAKTWYDMIQEGKGPEVALQIIVQFSQGKFPKDIQYTPGTRGYQSAWKETVEAADEANEPGRFTAFIGYEWTSLVAGSNLHRNVIFRDAGDKALQMEPMTCSPPLGSVNPRDLWKWMETYEAKTGGQVLAIAHNGNLSNGLMFPMIESFTGKPYDRAYAEQRAKWERIYEATQIKGDGETHPLLSPNDEFAAFERWDKGNLDLSANKKPEMLPFEYARTALANGLKLEQQLGVNPYKFGMIGSTDTHTGLAAPEEENFFGKTSNTEPGKERTEHVFIEGKGTNVMSWEQTASGYAAVWATGNTREELFDAMERRETYATTGPRMTVRFFGGWSFEQGDAANRLPASIGYEKGVPMGGDLPKAPDAKAAPSFLVAALKDPISGNLDRLQIVKGWLDAKGDIHERIYDVAVSGDRKIDGDGRCKTSVGNTVDVAKATWTNTIGASDLIGVWKDPDFDPAERAFYYVRAIEIPTPRWTAYDAKKFGLTLPKEVPMTTTERAYTSPIWYTPAAS